MKPVRAHFLLRLYGELPDGGAEADDAFDGWADEIVAVLNRHAFGGGIVDESFSIEDGNTEPDV